MPFIADFVALCLKQTGEQYVYGAEVRLDDPDPAGPWDCSELTQWASSRMGLPLPDGSHNQMVFCQNHGTLMPIEEGISTQGALLFIQTAHEHHVAVSLGNHSTIEARGHAYGVGSWTADGRPWTHAGRVPGFDYGMPPAPPAPPAAPPSNAPAWPGRYITQPPLMRGDDVRVWQARMHQRGWKIAVDGTYGNDSEAVCRKFQAEKHLQVDGVIGPATWRAAWSAPIS